jgi:hypothetical protein
LAAVLILTAGGCTGDQTAELEAEDNMTSSEFISSASESEITSAETAFTEDTSSEQSTAKTSADTTSQFVPSSREIKRLSSDKVIKIKNDYLAWIKLSGIENNIHGNKMTIDDIVFGAYYGKYGNAEFIKINYSGQGIPEGGAKYTEIAGFKIPGSLHFGELFYVDGSFFNIHNAYEQGILTKQNLCDLQEYKKYETTDY